MLHDKRVGVPITYLLTRGQQIKVISQLYRKAKQKNLLIPVRQVKKEDEKYEGYYAFLCFFLLFS
jgi:DNA polymerase delta subunit 1